VFAAVSISLVGRAQTYQQTTTPPSPVSTVVAQPQPDINSIVAANLFGVYENVGGNSGVLARSSLNVVVTGLLAFGASGGMATMSVDGKPETSFATGEEILPGVRLHAVENEHVIVSRNGQLEIVPLKEFAGSGTVSLVMASANTTAAMPASASPWIGQRGMTQLAANTVSSDSQSPAPQSTEPRKQKQHGKNGGAGLGAKSSGTGAGATNGGPAGPQPVPAGTGSNVTVPRPPVGGSVPQIPRPAPGAPVPDVPRPAPGAPVPDVPRPAPGAPAPK